MVTAGVYLVVRSNFIFDNAPVAQTAVVVVGMVTLLWGAIIGCAKDDIKKVLAEAYRDPAFRARFRRSLAAPRRGTLFYGAWHRVLVETPALPGNRALQGRSIAEIAAGRGADPLDAFLDLALEEGLETLFLARLVNASEDELAPLLRHDCAVIALSDAGAHLSFLCDAGYGLHLLGHWVRERGTFELGAAVRKLTSVPAAIYGIAGRGRLAPGYAADLLLFDPETVGCSAPRRVHDLPGGHMRIVRDPIGVHGVWVNGEPVGAASPAKRPPGEVLRRFAR
jgi:N-acyl-D-aspartate/D-glutamate deacylase